MKTAVNTFKYIRNHRFDGSLIKLILRTGRREYIVISERLVRRLEVNLRLTWDDLNALLIAMLQFVSQKWSYSQGDFHQIIAHSETINKQQSYYKIDVCHMYRHFVKRFCLKVSVQVRLLV